MKIIEKLKQKWGVGIWGFLAIMAAFSLAGTSSVLVRKKMIFLPEDLPVFINILFFFLIYSLLSYLAIKDMEHILNYLIPFLELS